MSTDKIGALFFKKNRLYIDFNFLLCYNLLATHLNMHYKYRGILYLSVKMY